MYGLVVMLSISTPTTSRNIDKIIGLKNPEKFATLCLIANYTGSIISSTDLQQRAKRRANTLTNSMMMTKAS